MDLQGVQKLSRILIPDIRKTERIALVERNKERNKKISEMLEKFTCSCGGKCKQTRSGPLSVECQCEKRYRVKRYTK